jgi:SOS-response transcriptional repressor LexA
MAGRPRLRFESPTVQKVLETIKEACLETKGNFPTMRTLMDATGIKSSGHVQTVIGVLEDAGEIELHYYGSMKYRTLTKARFTIDEGRTPV